jgi:hypothetical protein
MSNRLKILAIVKENPNASADSFELCFQSEATRVWELYQAGIIREMNFRQDKSEAVLMHECAGIEDAQEILNSLHLVREGTITFEIIPLKPYPSFSRLFAH